MYFEKKLLILRSYLVFNIRNPVLYQTNRVCITLKNSFVIVILLYVINFTLLKIELKYNCQVQRDDARSTK